jgi:RNA polymerase II subunit A small phosphatase-like protein
MNDLRPLLILDIDETLIHATVRPYTYQHDFMVFNYYVYKRPYLEDFLKTCSLHFNLAIWSSATDDYVKAIVAEILPNDISLAFCWGRSRCTPKFTLPVDEYGAYFDTFSSHYDYTKQFKKVRKKGYNLEKVLMVDDTPSKVANSYGNAIYIQPFEGSPQDVELYYLKEYLLKLSTADNYRCIEKRFWRKEVQS